jgi:hypothetical protein
MTVPFYAALAIVSLFVLRRVLVGARDRRLNEERKSRVQAAKDQFIKQDEKHR